MIETVQTLFDGTARYRQVTPLDGVLFVIYLSYNTRDENWYLSLHDSDDNPIRGCVGRKVVVNYPVLLRSVSLDRPAGELLVVSNTMGDPGLLDLGDSVALTYIPRADVEASLREEDII